MVEYKYIKEGGITMRETIKLTNTQIIDCYNILFKIPAKGRQARALSKFNNKLSEINSDYMNALSIIMDDYAETYTGEQIIWKSEKSEEANSAFLELRSSEEIIDILNMTNYIDDLLELLNQCDISFVGQEVHTYDLLIEKLEEVLSKINSTGEIEATEK